MNLALFRGAVNRAAQEFDVDRDKITLANLFSDTRTVKARAAVLMILLENGESINESAKYLGYSDHSGANLLLERYRRMAGKDQLFRGKIQRIREAA